MRSFGEDDRKKKRARIQLRENPGELSTEVLSHLEDMVKASLKDGYLPCSVAWEIAKEANVTKATVGAITDRLGTRITNCQIGCFQIEKTLHDNSVHESIDGVITTMLETLKDNNQLTCAKVFDLARQFKLKPMVIANEANVRDLKIHGCQLGCF